MANFHLHAQMISRSSGKSAVAKLAYRSATKLVDRATGLVHNYTNKPHVTHVRILTPDNASDWITEIAKACEISRQTAAQKFSDICEAHEKRKDAQVYREVEFSLPNELTDEQNIAWAETFIRDVFCKRGMVAVCSFHFDVDSDTGLAKPHCHTLLTTRPLTESGFGLKNRDWNDHELIEEAREQCAAYQNAALKEHGFDVRVTHLSYAERGIDIDSPPRVERTRYEMAKKGKVLAQEGPNLVKLINQFRVLKNPEVVFDIVTSKQSIFARSDIAKVLHRYISDAQQFQILLDRLMTSSELVRLESKNQDPIYTTKSLLRLELDVVKKGESLSVQHTHEVSFQSIEETITKQNEELAYHGGLTVDQKAAITHMLQPSQLSCVVGFAGAGKTTCLEAATQAWEASGFQVLGLAPTGKAAVNMESGVPRAMTVHKFLLRYEKGQETASHKTVLVLDEAGMVGSRLFHQLLEIIEARGTKLVIMGDHNQLQAVDAGPALRLLLDRVKPAVLDTIVRQHKPWQKEATRLFGMLQTRQALECYKDHFVIVKEPLPDFNNPKILLDTYCLARQISGRIWQEMVREDREAKEKLKPEEGVKHAFDFKALMKHQDYPLYETWRDQRKALVERLIWTYDRYEPELRQQGVDCIQLKTLVQLYQANPEQGIFKSIEAILREFSLNNLMDTRAATREAMVTAWVKEVDQNPTKSLIMIAHTNKDAHHLNQRARSYMRGLGAITGPDHAIATQWFHVDDFGKPVIEKETCEFAKGDRLLFTKNDTKLKVKNGTLGKIEAITPQQITALLDETNERLSFSPRLYPFITSGWAATIHKAQGVTSCDTHFLASFGQYRNLTYVGMTRHRDSVKLYASDLDFWRPEKIIDRLSLAQEKLSGLDYLEVKDIEALLQDDHQVLWSEAKFIQAKDLWTAIKVTAKQVTGFGNQEPGIRLQESGFGAVQEYTQPPKVKGREAVDTRARIANDGVERVFGRDQLSALTNKIKAVNDKYDLVDVHVPEPERVQMFMEQTADYFKSKGVEDGIFERSCHMLSHLEEVNELTSYEMRDVPYDRNHGLRVSIVAARIWHERTVDKTKPYQNPVVAAIAEVKKHVQEHQAFVSRLQNRYAEHLPPDKMVPIADHAIRVQEAAGTVLDDVKLHELACKVEANTLPQGEEIHYLGETTRILSFQLSLPKGLSREAYNHYLKSLTPEDYPLFTQIHEVGNRRGLTPAALPNKEVVHTFMHQSYTHLKAMGIGEEAAFAMSCHMLSHLDKAEDPRVSVLAAHLWHTDKPHSYQDHIALAEKMIKEYDATRNAGPGNFGMPQSEHCPRLLKTLNAHHEQTHNLHEMMKTMSLQLQQQRTLQRQLEKGLDLGM